MGFRVGDTKECQNRRKLLRLLMPGGGTILASPSDGEVVALTALVAAPGALMQVTVPLSPPIFLPEAGGSVRAEIPSVQPKPQGPRRGWAWPPESGRLTLTGPLT